MAKEKVKVLVKIFILEDGDEGEILRQFEVKAKEKGDTKTPASLALKISQVIDKEWATENMEAWSQ